LYEFHVEIKHPLYIWTNDKVKYSESQKQKPTDRAYPKTNKRGKKRKDKEWQKIKEQKKAQT